MARRIVAEQAELLTRGAEVVQGWPNSMLNLLGRIQIKPTEGRRELILVRDALPGLQRRLNKMADDAWRTRIQDCVFDFVARSRNTDQPIVSRAGPHLATLKEVATGLGVGVARLTEIAASDAALPVRTTKGGRRRLAISDGAVARLREQLEVRKSLKGSARELAVSSTRIRALVDANLLEVEDDGVSSQSVSLLVKLLLQHAATVDVSPSNLVAWQDALRKNIPLAMTGTFMQSVMSGSLWIGCLATKGTLSSAFFRRSDLIDWVERQVEAAKTGFLSVAQAARVLGIKEEMAYALVTSGLLATTSTRWGRRSARFVTPESLERFRSQFVSLAELARHAGIAKRSAPTWARSNGFELVTGPDVDGARQYFARRTTQG